MDERSKDEVQDELDEALAHSSEGINQYPGMTYAEGVTAALRWALGETDDKPYTEDL